jgi:hypothetical protein
LRAITRAALSTCGRAKSKFLSVNLAGGGDQRSAESP